MRTTSPTHDAPSSRPAPHEAAASTLSAGHLPFHPGVSGRTLAHLDFARILERLAEEARTVLGARLARVPRLFADRERVIHELSLTSEMRWLSDHARPPPFGGISDVSRLLAYAAKEGALEAADLLQIADTLRGMWLLRTFLEGVREETPGLYAAGVAVPEIRHVHEALYGAFDEDGTLRDDASPDLAELRVRRRSLHERVRRRIGELLRDSNVKAHLQDDYFTIREDRYVLPVRSGERGEVEGIIHGSSQTGQTLYIEPAELVTLNNELKLCEQAVLLEEHRILAGLTALVAAHRDEIDVALQVVAELDVICARGRLAAAMGAHAPAVPEDASEIVLDAARNPHLQLRGVPVVPNDVKLGGDFRMLVLTGPNAGGKTVTLNTVGLCALMARAGLHIPCGPDSRLPVYSQILTLLGDNQDLQADLSTFSGHLERVREILEQVGPNSLVLLDELAVGTEPSQGAALALAVAEAIVDRGAIGVVTTHYERLKTMSLGDGRFQNGAVGLDERTHEPTYLLTLGMPGSSSALEVAARLGLDPDVIDRAAELLGDKGRSMERVLQQLDEEKERLRKERERFTRQRERLERELSSIEAERARIEEEGDLLVRKAREEALEEIAAIRRRMALIIRDLQREPSGKVVQRRRVQVSEAERRLQEEARALGQELPKAADEYPELPRSEARPGLEVWVPAFGREGIIAEVRGNKAIVALGSIRTTVALSGLRLPKAKKVSKAPRAVPDIRELAAPPRTSDNTCDVRGQRVEEALDAVERFLDAAMLKNWSAVFVLHGHGTGRLKSGLRDGLQRSRYVERFEAAAPDHGGDAVTLVWLR